MHLDSHNQTAACRFINLIKAITLIRIYYSGVKTSWKIASLTLNCSLLSYSAYKIGNLVPTCSSLLTITGSNVTQGNVGKKSQVDQVTILTLISNSNFSFHWRARHHRRPLRFVPFPVIQHHQDPSPGDQSQHQNVTKAEARTLHAAEQRKFSVTFK